MKMTRSILLLVSIIILVLSMTGCVRSIPGSTSPQPTATLETLLPENLVSPGPTGVMDQIYLFATQTVMASGQGVSSPMTPGSQTTPAPETVPVTQTDATLPPEGSPVVSLESPAVPVEPTNPTPAPVVIVVPPATPGLPSSYTLQHGEFPYCIARRYNVNPVELMRMNGLTTYSIIYAGMSLLIPQTGSQFPGERALLAHPATYVVRAGDTIYSISCTFGDVSPDSIVFANPGLTAPYSLTPGQVINIP